MKLLLLSCHEVLEYDELHLWHQLGIECYSLGAYTRPGGNEFRKRPPLPDLPYDPHFVELADRYGKELHEEQLRDVDFVIIMHTPEFIEQNMMALKKHCAAGGRVVWRSIGQSAPWVETKLKLFKQILGEQFLIVRYSPLERNITPNAGSDALIRFAKDPRDYLLWCGTAPMALTFVQNFLGRGDHLNSVVWHNVRHTIGANILFVAGPDNEPLAANLGLLSYEAQLQALSQARCYFYLGTAPAPYTLGFVEALFAGTPIVSVGCQLGNNQMYPQNTFEVPDLLRLMQKETNLEPLFSDSVTELGNMILKLVQAPDWDVSTAQRQFALTYFSYDVIGPQWMEFFDAH